MASGRGAVAGATVPGVCGGSTVVPVSSTIPPAGGHQTEPESTGRHQAEVESAGEDMRRVK